MMSRHGSSIAAVLSIAGLAGLAGAALAGFTGVTARRIEKALPPSGRFIDIDGSPIHYVDEGAGPPIVMIHGLGGQLRHFTFGVVDGLAAKHRVIAFDRPGSGHSPREAGAPANLTAQAQTVAGLIRALGLKQPLVVGHSLGGGIALALALDHPDCVGGLALVAPLTHPVSKPPEPFKGLAIKSPLMRQLIGWTIATPAAIRYSRRTMDSLFGPDPVETSFALKGGGLLSLRPSSFYSASTDLAAAGWDLPGMVARYGSLKLPVGILYGTGDRILDHTVHGTAMQGKIPGIEIELIEAGGHMIPISAPGRVIAFIERTAARMSETTEKRHAAKA